MRSVGKGELGGDEDHLSARTMGTLVNEFASQLIRQPYFSRISSDSRFGTGAALSAAGGLAGSTDFSGCADVLQDGSCI